MTTRRLPDGFSRWVNGLLLLEGACASFLESDPQLGVTVIFAAPGKSPGKSPGKIRRIVGVIVSEMTIPTYRGAVDSVTEPPLEHDSQNSVDLDQCEALRYRLLRRRIRTATSRKKHANELGSC